MPNANATINIAVPINEPDEPVLTPEQVWEGLEIRARNGDKRFVPPGHTFEVIEDRGSEILRSFELNGGDPQFQRISFHGDRVMVFDFLSGSVRATIINAIEDDDTGECQLRFTFITQSADGSVEPAEVASKRRASMERQPAATLAVIRALAQEGKL